MSNLPAEIFQISRSVAGSWSLDAARTMRDYAAHLGAGLPKYLLAPEVALLLSYIDDLTARMYFETLWNTGARLNEALALTPVCFTLEPSRRHPQAVVMLKTLKQRNREAVRGVVARLLMLIPGIPIRATGNRLSLGLELCLCSMPTMYNGCGNTSPPGENG